MEDRAEIPDELPARDGVVPDVELVSPVDRSAVAGDHLAVSVTEGDRAREQLRELEDRALHADRADVLEQPAALEDEHLAGLDVRVDLAPQPDVEVGQERAGFRALPDP